MKADEIKTELVLYAKLMEEKGLVNMLEGNISILDRETGLLYITPSGTRKATLTTEQIAVMKGDEQIEGSKPRSSEYLLHKAALEARPDCMAVIHTHAPFMTAYAYCNRGIDIKCSSTFAALHNGIPCIPYGEPGSIDITNGLTDALQGHSTVLLANHGAVCTAKSLGLAFGIIESTEEVLKIYEKAKVMGVANLTDEQLEHWKNSSKKRRSK